MTIRMILTWIIMALVGFGCGMSTGRNMYKADGYSEGMKDAIGTGCSTTLIMPPFDAGAPGVSRP